MSQPPPLRRSKPVWLRLLLVFGLIVGLLAGAVLGFNAYASAKLRAAIAEYEADGESLDFRSLLPESVPDEQNFCAIRELLNLADPDLGRANRERIEAMALPGEDNVRGPRPPFPNGATTGKPADLAAWARWLTGEHPQDEAATAEAVESALLKDAELIEALVAAIDRPEAAWTPAWKERELPDILAAVPLPHCSSSQHLGQSAMFLSMVSILRELPDEAIKRIEVQLRLVEANWNDPMFIGALVGMVEVHIAVSPVWEMCFRRDASQSDFRRLASSMERLELVETLLRAFRTEAASGMDLLGEIKTNPSVLASLSQAGEASPSVVEKWLVSMMPDGYFDLSAVPLIRIYHQNHIQPLRQGDLQRVGVDGVIATSLNDSKSPSYIFGVLARMFTSVSLPILARARHTDALLQFSATACKLEAHHAEHGGYPESPVDLPPGMRYERTATRYRLWLPGPDGEDDGGKRILDPEKPEKTKFHADDYQGDWVWDYPEE